MRGFGKNIRKRAPGDGNYYSRGFGHKKSARTGVAADKKRMTLDFGVSRQRPSRVIPVLSWYLTSVLNLSFCRFRSNRPLGLKPLPTPSTSTVFSRSGKIIWFGMSLLRSEGGRLATHLSLSLRLYLVHWYHPFCVLNIAHI